jgi:hypothetical protein
LKRPDSLAIYQSERDALLRRITRQARADPRIAAAWLFGSLGRGTADALSDLDVWLVVDDAHVQACLARRREAAAEAGTPVLLLEAPQNAPRAGGYLMASYDAPIAPHQVDWYWQLRSLARIPTETRVLFDRAGLPRAGTPTLLVAGDAKAETVEEPLNSISYFWAMLMICAKGIYRCSSADELREEPLLRYVLDALQRVESRVGLAPTGALTLGGRETRSVKMNALRQLGRDMQAATRQAASQGLTVPERAAPAAMRYLEFVEGLARHEPAAAADDPGLDRLSR